MVFLLSSSFTLFFNLTFINFSFCISSKNVTHFTIAEIKDKVPFHRSREGTDGNHERTWKQLFIRIYIYTSEQRFRSIQVFRIASYFLKSCPIWACLFFRYSVKTKSRYVLYLISWDDWSELVRQYAMHTCQSQRPLPLFVIRWIMKQISAVLANYILS